MKINCFATTSAASAIAEKLTVSESDSTFSSAESLRQRALSRWDTEGGAGRDGAKMLSGPHEAQGPAVRMDETELVSLHIRVIALENLVISLLATASESQLKMAHEMAAYISPRPGFTPHPVTTRAADHMIDLVDRALRFDGDGGTRAKRP